MRRTEKTNLEEQLQLPTKCSESPQTCQKCKDMYRKKSHFGIGRLHKCSDGKQIRRLCVAISKGTIHTRKIYTPSLVDNENLYTKFSRQ